MIDLGVLNAGCAAIGYVRLLMLSKGRLKASIQLPDRKCQTLGPAINTR